jgi:hypothetical protein
MTTDKSTKTSTTNKPRNSNPTNNMSNTETKSFESLNFIQELKDTGYTVVKEKENATHTFLSVYPTYYKVDDKKLAIYEYNNEEEAKKDSKTISNGGYGIGGAKISWVDVPHFYQKGEIIVSYIGSDNKLLYDLGMILGK